MNPKEKLTAWQHARKFFVFCLWIEAFTASSIQYFAEKSLLLTAYNWLIGIGVVMFLWECSLKGKPEKKPIEFSKPLVVLGWIIGIVGTIICIVYNEYVFDVVNTFGSRHHTGN